MTKNLSVIIPLQVEGEFAPKSLDPSVGAKNLVRLLRQTAADEVTVKVSQVTELLGEKVANDLCIMCTKMATAKTTVVNTNSLIPLDRRTTLDILGMYVRRDLLSAIVDVNPSLSGEETAKGVANPDPVKLAMTKKENRVPLNESDKEALRGRKKQV